MSTPSQPDSPSELRRQANAALQGRSVNVENLSRADILTLIHELQVHQIEMGIQNEELKNSQNALEQTRSRYFDLYNFAPVGYLTLDTQAKIVEHNRTFADMLTRRGIDLRDRDFTEFVVPESQDTFHFFFQALMKGEISNCEVALSVFAKAGLWGRLEGRPSVKNGERTVEFSIAVIEVTRQKRVEQALHDSEIRYRRLFEAAKDGVLLLDANTGTITDVNPFLMDLLGLPYEAFFGKELWEIGLFKDAEAARIAFRELQTNKYVRYDNLPLKARDGRPINVEVVSNVYQADGHAVIQCNIRDISERILVEGKLEKERQTLEELVAERTDQLNRALEHVEAILDSTSDAILVLHADGNIQKANLSFNRLFGYQNDEVMERSVGLLATSDSSRLLSDALTIAMTTGTLPRIEIEARRKDTSTFPAEIGLSIIQHTGGFAVDGVLEIVCSVRDITERKLVESELQNLNKIKSEFLSSAAHELRTPLVTILGFSEIMLTRTLSAERSKHFLELINEQSIQLRKIIDSLLDISRIEANQNLILDLQPINIRELITHTIAYFVTEQPTIQFEFEETDAPGMVVGDALRLGQVLQNLISNAIKYSPEKAAISIGIETTADTVQVRIEDHGIGMTNEQQTHLFERFYRANTSNTAVGGTGLGLAISKLIIELHGGRIWVTSEANIGTTVFFILRRAA